DDAMMLHIDHDGAVDVATTQGELVHAEHTGGWHVGLGQGTHEAEQRRPACAQTEAVTQALTRSTAEGQADLLERRTEGLAPSGVARDERRDLLGEGP